MDKDVLHARLKKAAGQVMAVDRMLAEGRDTAALLEQLNAANSALMKVGEMLLEDSISDRLDKLSASDDDKERTVTEIRRLFSMI